MVNEVLNHNLHISQKAKDKKKENQFFKTISDGRLVKCKLEDQLINDFSISEHLEHKNKLINIESEANKQVYRKLLDLGYTNIPDGLLNRLELLITHQTIKPDTDYITVDLDKKGFVCYGNRYVVPRPAFYSELFRGYYRIESDELGNKYFDIDLDKKREYLNTL